MKTFSIGFRVRLVAYLAIASVFCFLSFFSQRSEAEELGAGALAGLASGDSPLTFLGRGPAWSLVDMRGERISAESLKGKVVVVDFWATWCPPCVAEIPGYVALQQKYGRDGLVIVGVSLDQGKDPEQKVNNFAAKHAINYPLAMSDGDIVEAFETVAGPIQYIPTTFLIDREGNVRHHKVGSMNTADYEQVIRAALN